ncbi:MAG: hypothetical protein Q4C20_12350 [Erysipelotrichaceae bacterium]|nr:hypothetical protein [Erysipelotrichaceae bacterium]
MIDLHTHILPGVDDGSQDIDTSLGMIYKAYQSGVRDIVTTPHFYPGLYDNYVNEDLKNKWNALNDRVKRERISVRLYKGMEILGTDRLCDDLVSHRVWTINHTKYFLVEFDFDEDPSYCSKILDESYDIGYIPVVAHPERYYFVQKDPAIVYEWFMKGYGIQVNKGSILGYFGEREMKTADSLIRHHIVSCTASDAHGMNTRTPSMTHLKSYLSETYSNGYMNLLMVENPSRILDGRRLVGYDPIPYNYESERQRTE